MLKSFVISRGLTGMGDAAIAAALNAEFEVGTYTAYIVGNWFAQCTEEEPILVTFPPGLVCDLDMGIDDVDEAVQANCENENFDLAAYNANVAYQNLVTAAADAYMEAYINKCLTAPETFTVEYLMHEYYYTLYYYDQAGNLVKTVPPEGVNLVDFTADDDADGIDNGPEIITYRNDFRDGTTTLTVTFTPAVHDMRSVYAYNSLQQPIKAQQNEQGNTSGTDVWESGETNFWYDYLGRLVVSQNTKQFNMSPKAYSYTIYDDLGRISEVGEIHTNTILTADADDATGSRDNNGYYYYYEITSSTALEDFLTTGSPIFNDVTKTYYDETMPSVTAGIATAMGGAQENLRNRVSSVVYDDDPAGTANLYTDATTAGAQTFLNAFHYSYDIHGNVKAMVQETPALETHNQSLKVTTYNYDLISGNVNSVYFQRGERDEFDHKYEYDADNRMHASYSSRDGVTWEKESKQFYYTTGGMGRLEIGDKTVQGEDYAYTINGWMKGMNRNTIGDNGTYMERDLGQDAHSLTNNLNKNFGADAAGFTLDYFLGDYTAVNSTADFEAGKASTDYGTAMREQFNGNIAGMVTAMNKNDETYLEVQGRLFTYDQLYRLKEALAYHMDATIAGSNTWHASYAQDNRYKESFTYDWNGNIKTVDRYSGDLSMGTAVLMDELTYSYAANSNLLKIIYDATTANCAGSGGYADDLDDQTGYMDGSGNNYIYDETGALVSDYSERIGSLSPLTTGIEWNPYGKMKAVHKDQSNNTNACTSTEYGDADVEYLYTASQQRLCKIVKPHKTGGAGIDDQDKWTYYWYAYDASGQVMAVYKQTFSDVSAGIYKVHVNVQEHDVYGSGRVGIRLGDEEEEYELQFTGTKATTGPDAGKFNSITYGLPFSPTPKTHYTRELGNKQYEIANHLGNVLVTVSDKRQAVDPYAYTLTGNGSDYTYNPRQYAYEYTPGTGLYTQTAGSDGLADWYTPDVLSYTDYYAFGAAQSGRAGGDPYRYKFNGMETDPESKNGEGLDYTTEYRTYDARVGRWFSKDPIVKHWESPYAAFANNPIFFNDPAGLNPSDPQVKNKGNGTGSETSPDGKSLDLSGATDVYTYTGTQRTIGGTSVPVAEGSVGRYTNADGVTYIAVFYKDGGFSGYEVKAPSSSASTADPAVVAVPTEGADGLFKIPPAEGSTVITSEGNNGGHVPSQDELCGINYNTGVNGNEVALAAGAQYMEKGLLVVTGGVIVIGAVGGVALFTAPVWGTALAVEATMISQYGGATLYSYAASATGVASVGLAPRFFSAGADLTLQAMNGGDINRTSVLSQFIFPHPYVSSSVGSTFEYNSSGLHSPLVGNKTWSTCAFQTGVNGLTNHAAGVSTKFMGGGTFLFNYEYGAQAVLLENKLNGK
jgi:RHS repeat-associated protein